MQTRERVRERQLEANGLSHHVLEWGDPDASDVVLLCHGFLDLAWGFAQLGPQLAAAGMRAIAVDFRGHGQTSRVPPGGYYYFPDYVLDLHELVPQLVSAPFHLLGHSMGGTVSSLFAATHPDQLRSLTLLEGLGPKHEDASRAPARMAGWLADVARTRSAEPAKLRDLDEAFARLSANHSEVEHGFLRQLAAKGTLPHPSGEGLMWQFDPLHRTLSPIAFDSVRFGHCLSQIRASTLVVHGERGFRSLDDAERVARIPRARQVVIEGAGHMLHWTHCEQIRALALAHMQGA